MTEELRDRVHSVFRRCQLSLNHPWFTAEKLHYGTTTILVRRDGDLYAAIPDNQIGKCRYIMCGTFDTGRKGLDASLEAGLEAHRELITSKYPNGGIGSDPFITIGKKRLCYLRNFINMTLNCNRSCQRVDPLLHIQAGAGDVGRAPRGAL